MEDCFRFLINIDQCLKMSSFDIFFYKLRHRHKLYIDQVQMFTQDFGSSLRHAANDIRAYLNKYPYHVGDYHIIVTMRSDYISDPAWKNTMLYRLVHLHRELTDAHIYLNSRERADKSLSMVMLYDADFSAELPSLDNYMSGRRFSEDCRKMLSELGLDENCTFSEFNEALARYTQSDNCDAAVASLLQGFSERQRDIIRDVALLKETTNRYLDDPREIEESYAPDDVAGNLHAFLKNDFSSFQVFEMLIDRNNLRDSILSLLRVVEFINMSTTTNRDTIQRLTIRVRENWDAVMNDAELELKYAKMLYFYKLDLSNLAMDLEGSDPTPVGSKTLPPPDIPSETDIKLTADDVKAENTDEKVKELRDSMKRYAGHVTVKEAGAQWKEIYSGMKSVIWDLDGRLMKRARALSSRYSEILEKRNREYAAIDSDQYSVSNTTAREIDELNTAREEIFNLMKNPRMNSSLSFQDRLNMENALEEENVNISFYVRCLENVRTANMLLLILLCAIPWLISYTALQPYVYKETGALAFCILYIAAALVLMLLMWNIPRRYFARKIKKSVENLLEYTDKYLKAYAAKEQDFEHYINLLNRLDYITRSHQLRSDIYRKNGKLTKHILWQKVQVKKHLEKLKYFSGLIELYEKFFNSAELEARRAAAPAQKIVTEKDVVDNSAYWPQR